MTADSRYQTYVAALSSSIGDEWQLDEPRAPIAFEFYVEREFDGFLGFGTVVST